MGQATRSWLACGLAVVACDSSGRSGSPLMADSARVRPAMAGVADTNATRWHIGPGRTGPITSQSSEAELRQRYGTAALDRVRIELGEGETAPGTVLYPGDSLQRIEILWRDTLNRRGPARLVLRGSRSRWQVGPGVSLGTSLKDLERLNGGPFMLAGFAWDYAGVITDWKGGVLDSLLARVKLYLDPGASQYQSPAYSQVLGDRDYSSGSAAMQQLDPKVSQIFVDFE